jgi:hypothetical protein
MPRSSSHSPTKSKPPSITPSKPSLPAIIPPPVTQPGFGQLIKEGIGFGAGQAIAHRAVNAILGPSITTPVMQQPTEPKGPCYSERNLFESCMRIKSQEDHCNNEHLAYTQCLELTQKSG